MRQNDLFDWYEANLPVKERKLRGHFSTPPHLVKQILDACGYTPEHELAQIRVLDPACGSGNFVSGAAQRLIAYGKRTGLSETAIARLVRRNIWGFDPDPVACFLAEMQMRDAFSERDIPEIESEGDWRNRNADAKRIVDIGQIQIHQADGLTFPWQLGGQVDLLLANPPYLAAKNNDLSAYRSAQQRGQADSYLLFLELALQVVRPDGWLGLVLPDPVLARSNAARERNRLLAETTVHHLWHLADVFAAYVGAVVIVAQKRSPKAGHHIAWRRERWQQKMEATEATGEHYIHEIHAGSFGNVSQKLLHLQEGAELRYLLSSLQGTLVERIYVQVTRAIHTERCTHGLVWLKDLVLIRRGEEISKESPLLSSRLPAVEDEMGNVWFPVLRGGSDIRPYGIPSARHWIARDKIVKPLERYREPKLLVVKSAGQLQACLDVHGHVVLQTLYTLSINGESTKAISTCVETVDDGRGQSSQRIRESFFSKEDEMYYLLALLNSRLLQEYVYVLHTAYKWVQPQIEQSVLAQLPIPGKKVDAREKEQIIQRSKQIMHACSNAPSDVELKEQRRAWYEEQEQAICRLYQAAIQERQQVKQELEQELALDVQDEGVIRYG